MTEEEHENWFLYINFNDVFRALLDRPDGWIGGCVLHGNSQTTQSQEQQGWVE